MAAFRIVGSLDDLEDVDAASPADGNALKFDQASGTWKPGAVSSGDSLWTLDGDKLKPTNATVRGIEFGDGTNPSDVTLARPQQYVLQLTAGANHAPVFEVETYSDDAHLNWVNGSYLGPASLDIWDNAATVRLYHSDDTADARITIDVNQGIRFGPGGAGGADLTLKRESAGSLELVPDSGASDLVLHSPNGTRYRLSVNNSGALSAAAA
jgi:hypothetical protein